MRALVALAVEDGRDDADDDEHGGGERQPLAGWPLLEEGSHFGLAPVVLYLHQLGSGPLGERATNVPVANPAVKVVDPMALPWVTWHVGLVAAAPFGSA